MHHNLSNDSTSNHSNMSDYSSVAPPQNFAQSSAYAAAVQRAQQIAAKMNSGITGTQDPQKKRSLEDGPEPEAKKIAPVIPDPLTNLRGNTTPGIPTSIAESTKPAGSTTPNPVPLGICNEDIRVPDKMVGLIIGRGGEQITRLQSETGCKIQMAAESGGLPERTCTLTGSRDAVNRAKELVQSIVSQRNKPEDQIPGANPPYPGPPTTTPTTPTTLTGHPGFVEIMIPGPKVGLIIGKGGETIKQLQEKSGAKMVVIQEGPAQEQEKPLRITGDPQKVEHAKQLVYELIAEKEMQMYNRGTRNSFSGNNSFSQDGGSTAGDGVEVFVPKDAVGVIIGKGGDMIKKLQQETGAKIQFIQLKGEGPGDRTCSISGASDCVETARQRIQDMIDSVLKGKNNPRGNGFNSAGRPNEYGGGWDNQRTDMTNKIEFSYPVPSNKCGIIIGKSGETIKQINQQTGAHCELDRRNPRNTKTDQFFTIRGTPEQVEHAKRIFAEKLGGGMTTPNSMYGAQNTMGFNPSWNAAPGYQAWPGQTPATDPNAANQGQVQINPATGQPDYSAQWAEYYRSLGMHREAEMIEQQAKQQQAAAAAAAKPEMSQQAAQQPNPAPTNPTQQQPQQQQQSQQQQQGAQQNGGQADYSAQWAEYYRSIGKIEEAEAIEAQMKNRKTSGGMQSNQMGQSQQQPQQSQMQPNPMSNQGGAPGGPGPGGAPNAFPQPYGGYPGMNPASGGYYTPAGQPTSGQPAQPGQQNSAFPTTGYQNYQYPQASSDN